MSPGTHQVLDSQLLQPDEAVSLRTCSIDVEPGDGVIGEDG
jgi:hypothetical protein